MRSLFFKKCRAVFLKPVPKNSRFWEKNRPGQNRRIRWGLLGFFSLSSLLSLGFGLGLLGSATDLLAALQLVPHRVFLPLVQQPKSGLISFTTTGYTQFGDWSADLKIRQDNWVPGQALDVQATLEVFDSHLSALETYVGRKADSFCLLLTAERTFDAEGHLHMATDEQFSTLLTPTRLPIEGGFQGPVTTRFGYAFKTPVDQFATIPLAATRKKENSRVADFQISCRLPTDLPPGIYRLRFDFGIVAAKWYYYYLNGYYFPNRPFFSGKPTESHVYSRPIPAYGMHVSGRRIDAAEIRPRLPWTLLHDYNSNGYRGVVAEEDKDFFALSSRNLIQDAVILPIWDDWGNRLSYSLEPRIPTDSVEARSNIPWDYTKGELSIRVTRPDGVAIDLGTAPFVEKGSNGPTTKLAAFTAWKPPLYGQYKVSATGWMQDVWGNRYEAGGTYTFWIAKRMTMATATFQGMPYPVGSRYGRDIGFAPAFPADVEMQATLYVNSDPSNRKTVTSSGKASTAGIFGAAQGMKPLLLDTPGEYAAQILARHTDPQGHLWVCSMRHAGVVYPADSPIVARGKKLKLNGQYVDRGETLTEGNPDSLVHINFPFQPGDVLLLASDQQYANKIEPVLTYDRKDQPLNYESRLQSLGATNLRIQTSNGYTPHLFPEYITDWAYYYAGAPRPGFMGRFLVADDGVRAPYWQISPNSFGGQVGASNNGDLPGDIYRLIGGVVLRKKGESPAYAGYLASAFILPKGTNNNRVVAAGSEDLNGSDGSKARFFLVGTRPGMVYETGTLYAPAIQIDPVLPVYIKAVLTCPDGSQKIAQGMADAFGTFVGAEKWSLDLPGLYRFWVEGEWQGYKGYMPGLPRQGGDMYVVEKDRPAGAPSILLDLPNQSTFSAATGLTITGYSSAAKVYYSAVMPGAVLAQGEIPVQQGVFTFTFNPATLNASTPTYDIANKVSGRAEIGDVVHLTFFSGERTGDGAVFHSFARVILRGTRVFYSRPLLQ